MTIDSLRTTCLKWPVVTEDVRWENDLCLLVAGKMFCIASLDASFRVSFKITDDEYEELLRVDDTIPASCLTWYKWIQIHRADGFHQKEWERLLHQSCEFVKSKLSKKLFRDLGLL
jgi:predicted DNA-binding protein (MmcQ/YjbR family)